MSLELAFPHKVELYQLFAQASTDPKFKYYFANGYHIFESQIDGNDWDNVQMVSVIDGEILGYFNAAINRAPRYVHQLGCINFTDDPFVFSRDLMGFIGRLFEYYQFYKICFSVLVGNPSELLYDKAVDKLGARVVGHFEDHYETPDGEKHDAKWYEITGECYWNYKSKKEYRM